MSGNNNKTRAPRKPQTSVQLRALCTRAYLLTVLRLPPGAALPAVHKGRRLRALLLPPHASPLPVVPHVAVATAALQLPRVGRRTVLLVVVVVLLTVLVLVVLEVGGVGEQGFHLLLQAQLLRLRLMEAGEQRRRLLPLPLHLRKWWAGAAAARSAPWR